MVGIVVVSHSAPLAEAAVALAMQMVSGVPPTIVIASGTSDGRIGTDATRVAAAIDSLPEGEPAIVIMDLGSAVLSAEMSIEFLQNSSREIRMSSAPFVEGILAAVVRASGGGTLAEVASDAENALIAKTSQLGTGYTVGGSQDAATESKMSTSAGEQASSHEAEDVRGEAVIPNSIGLHARPAAVLAGALGEFDAEVWISVDGKDEVMGQSPISLMSLGARKGDVLHVRAQGPDRQAAMDTVLELTNKGFGELD